VGADRAVHVRVLHEELRPLGVVDERVDVARVRPRLLEPRVAAALVRHAGAPDLRCVNRRQQRELPTLDDLAATCDRGEQVVVVEHVDGVAVPAADTRAAFELDADEAVQYTARPPEMSKHAPVENVISSLASQQMKDATSSGSPMRPSGMRDVMKSMCSCDI